jgi:hypothetical protein
VIDFYSDLRQRVQQLSFDDPTIVQSIVRSAAYALNSELTAPLLDAESWILHCGDQAMVLVIDLQTNPARIKVKRLAQDYCETIYSLTGFTEIRLLYVSNIVWSFTRDRYCIWSAKITVQGGVS